MNSSVSQKIKILAVDDHMLFRNGLISFLKTFNMELECDGARNGKLAIEACENKDYNIILLDRRMDVMGGLETSRIIRKRFPWIKIVIMTGIGAEDKQEIYEMIDLGLDGYIYKGEDDDQLENIINLILLGGNYFNPEIKCLIEEYNTTGRRKEIYGLNRNDLTPKELEVAILLSKGINTAKIADKLCVSINTIHTHRHNILHKIGIDNSFGILEYLLRNGLYKIQ